ncbi:MIPC synthase [Purpureocillium lavendulum]|uniref:MIPC synthase n=1 Tax=Purpureocillium lavendulum TaxID=1247861 RepID=A0AB34FK94_9HYPO|nr:MIPC synthase [Purpureocillium lavendulum]
MAAATTTTTTTSPRVRRWAVGVLAVGAVFYFTVVFPKLLAFSRLFGPHAGTVLTQQQVWDAHNASLALPDSRPRPVPRMIHQVYLDVQSPANKTVPHPLEAARRTCESLHPTWEYKLWHNDEAREFIKSEYPPFLGVYDAFKTAQQRTDVLSYLLVRHFGGIYIDLHIRCDASLEPLLFYPAWVAYPGTGALSNDIIAGEPRHPFWMLMTATSTSTSTSTSAAKGKQPPSVLPRITAHSSTGPWYVTEMWERYHAEKSSSSPDLMLLSVDEQTPGGAPGVFFHGGEGSKERKKTSSVVEWVGRHPYQVTFFGLVALCAAAAAYLGLSQAVLEHQTTKKGYRVLEYIPTTWRPRADGGQGSRWYNLSAR